MEKKFIIPATTFLAGIIVWIALILVKETSGFPLWLELLLGLVTGSLIFYSGFRCKQVGGPRGGIIFRAVLLFALAVLSYIFIGTASAALLLVASVATVLLVFKSSAVKPELDSL